MKSTLFAIILSMLLIFVPIGDLNNQADILPNPFASHDILITLAPANDYIPSENELEAANASIENYLSAMDLYDCTVTSDKKKNFIIVLIPQHFGSKKYTPEEVISELCRKVEIKFIDPEGNVIIEGKHIKNCSPGYDTITLDHYIVRLEFNDEGTERFAEATARLIGQEIAIYVDGEVISSPVVEEAIPNGEAVINRVDTYKEAMAIASKIALGMLPYDLVPVSQGGNDAP